MRQYIDKASVSLVILEPGLSITFSSNSDIVYDGREVSDKAFNEDVCSMCGMGGSCWLITS